MIAEAIHRMTQALAVFVVVAALIGLVLDWTFDLGNPWIDLAGGLTGLLVLSGLDLAR